LRDRDRDCAHRLPTASTSLITFLCARHSKHRQRVVSMPMLFATKDTASGLSANLENDKRPSPRVLAHDRLSHREMEWRFITRLSSGDDRDDSIQPTAMPTSLLLRHWANASGGVFHCIPEGINASVSCCRPQTPYALLQVEHQ
jgi:hypothetical protein